MYVYALLANDILYSSLICSRDPLVTTQGFTFDLLQCTLLIQDDSLKRIYSREGGWEALSQL